jgi:hypothetical protein
MTILSRHVSLQLNRSILNLLVFLLSFLILLICLSWSYMCYGFDLGYELIPEENLTGITFSTSTIRTYQRLSDEYFAGFLIMLFFNFVLLLRQFKNFFNTRTLKILVVTNILLLFYLAYRFRNFLMGKLMSISDGLSSDYTLLFEKSVSYDWICLGIIIALVFIEIIQFFLIQRNTERVSRSGVEI